MSEPKYIEIRPKTFDPHRILAYVDALDKRLVKAEISYDEVKDQANEVFDFVVNEKMTNDSISVSLAKVKATNDERYMKVKKELSDKKETLSFFKG